MKDLIKLEQDCKLLIDYLLVNKNRYVCKEELCRIFPETFTRETETTHDVCVYIWTCKNHINNNVEIFNYQIISDGKGALKIPTREELIKAIKHEEAVKARAWKRLWNKKKALGLENQLTLDGYIFKVVQESNE